MDFSLISQTTLFRGYTPVETEDLLRGLRASVRRFVRDSAVYTAGKSVSNIGIVLSGTAQIENNDIWGNTSILGLVKPGEVFAEAHACVPGEPMMVDVIATEDTEILFVNVPEIFRLASSGKGNYTRLIQNLVIISARKNLTLSRRILHTSSKKIRGRLLSYLSYQAELQGSNRIEIPLNRQQLADYLCVERAAMSAELSRLQKQGLLTTNKNHFILQSVPDDVNADILS